MDDDWTRALWLLVAFLIGAPFVLLADDIRKWWMERRKRP